MEKIKVKQLLYYIGGYTKIIIGDCSDNKFTELWRGEVDDLDWDNIPCGDRYVEHITVVEGEDWLQIWVQERSDKYEQQTYRNGKRYISHRSRFTI